jgi:protein-disulfide isomerase
MHSYLKRAAVFCLMIGSVSADMVTYEGKLSIEGVPFTGLGHFKFALIGDHGETLWASNDIRLNVVAGTYAVRLGDSAEAPPISGDALRATTAPKLRIWFEREGKGWAVAGPDSPLVSIGRGNAGSDASQNAAMMAELHQIHGMLAMLLSEKQREAPTPEATEVTVSIAGAPALGKADAPLVLVEYTDFQCPYCARFQAETFRELKQHYVDTGKLRVVSFNLPLPIHPFALPAARAAFCAQEQDKFWSMRDNLFAVNGGLSAEGIRYAAASAGLNMTKLDACAASGESSAAVQKEVQQARAAGINGTPTFVLGKATGDKVTGLAITGAQPLAYFEAEVNKLLASGRPQ